MTRSWEQKIESLAYENARFATRLSECEAALRESRPYVQWFAESEEVDPYDAGVAREVIVLVDSALAAAQTEGERPCACDGEQHKVGCFLRRFDAADQTEEKA